MPAKVAVRALALLCVLLSTAAQDDDNREALSRILTLEGHCEESTCSDFHYENASQVAYFDLKDEVRIADDLTYDIVNHVKYDTLIFENSTFAHFPLHLFYSVSVKDLDLRNCSIEIVTWENFLMADSLRILLLSNNKIDKLDELTFNYASKLQYLFLDSNRLRTLVSESFKGLKQLSFLDLRHNRLKELPAGVFDYLPALQELHLDHNRLYVLGNEMFTNNPNMLTVSFSHNKLREVGEYAFKNQPNLVLLELSHNNQLKVLVITMRVRYLVAANCSLYRVNIYGAVQNVDLRDNAILELYFAQPESLSTLVLRNNSLQQIASLTRAVELRMLDLANNPDMQSLPESWNVNLLERLDISNTGLTQMPIAALAEQSDLRSLNVSQNKLREINPQNFKYLSKLTHFYIHANDWNCYNLNLIMDLLIRPQGMTYTPDEFDPDFPGEYVNGIACMYRLEQEEGEDATPGVNNEDVSDNAVSMSAQLNIASPTSDTDTLRKELKAIVNFYEEKFDKAFSMISDLNERLRRFERMNETFFQHVTITT